MPIRRLAGLAGIIVAAWMLWETVQPIQMQISRGSDLMTELLNPPVALLRRRLHVSWGVVVCWGPRALARVTAGVAATCV